MCKEAINKCGAATCPGSAAKACGEAATALDKSPPSAGIGAYEGVDPKSLLGPNTVKVVFVPRQAVTAQVLSEERRR